MSFVQCVLENSSAYNRLSDEYKSGLIITEELDQLQNEKSRLADEIDRLQSDIISLQEQSKKEYENVRRMHHFSIKSAAATLSGKKKEAIAKEENKYQLAFENEQRAKRQLEIKQKRYTDILNSEAHYSKQKVHIDHIRNQLDTLLEEIFSCNKTEYTDEILLREEYANYVQQNTLAIRDKGRFMDAEQILFQTKTTVNKIIRLLEGILNYVPFDIFGSQLIDQQQIAYIDTIKKYIWDTQHMLNNARTILPEIPHPETLDIVTNNPILSLQITLQYVDITWKAKTRHCLQVVTVALHNIKLSLNWVQQYKQYAEGAVHRLTEVLNTTKHRLHTERCNIIDSILNTHQSSLPAYESTHT